MSILCDTDFLLAAALSTEHTHARARSLYKSISPLPLYMVSLVKYELATVLSRKMEQSSAISLLKDLLRQPIAVISAEAHEEEALTFYYAQARKNISFTDCANVAVARKYGWKIASFDAFYPKDLRAEVS